MTSWEMFLALLVLLAAIGVMLAVFYLWFAVWKYVSDNSGNIVEWGDSESDVNNTSGEKPSEKK